MNMDLGDPQLQPLRVLGQGAFGRVFLCRCRQRKEERYVCVKRIIVQNPKIDMKMIRDEVYIVSQLKHPRIIQFIRSYVHAGTVNIVMEFAPNGTLRDMLHRLGKMPLEASTLLSYFVDTLMGLEYLHIRHVIHRDLKPENLLLDSYERIKIADFGISAVYTPNKPNYGGAGTAYYSAPEVMHNKKFDTKSDIWSLGCILYELCMGRTPFERATSRQALVQLVKLTAYPKFRGAMAVTGKYGPVWGNICEQMLVYEPEKRISLAEIVCIDAMITVPYYKQYFDYRY